MIVFSDSIKIPTVIRSDSKRPMIYFDKGNPDLPPSVTVQGSVIAPADAVGVLPRISNSGPLAVTGAFVYVPLPADNGHCKTSRRYREGVFVGKRRKREKLTHRIFVEAIK